jgi:acyl carrier protein
MQQEKLIHFIKKICRDKKRKIDPDTLLFKEKVLDSMNILDLIGYIEKQLGRRLGNDELVMSNFESIHRITEVFLKDYD